jgi:hypothetical protein
MFLDMLSIDQHVGLILNRCHQDTDTIVAAGAPLENANHTGQRAFGNYDPITGLKVLIHFDHAVFDSGANSLNDFFLDRYRSVAKVHNTKNASGIANLPQ